jgi:EmrB/QacA subfamily drug resistance transporter
MTDLRFGTARARWVIAAAALGSGIAFLDGTVVNVALPAIRTDLHMGVAGLQWTLDGYLVTLTALLLLGGSLGDVLGRRRVFVGGLVAFACASVVCGIAPNAGALVAARALQGAAAAFLIPGSLAIVSSTFHPDDRSRAVGAWSGLAGVTSAIGPFVGGYLIDAVSWRLIFAINVPLVALVCWMAIRHVPESRDEDARTPDWTGAAAVTVALAGMTYALIEGPARGGAGPILAAVVGGLALVAFLRIETTVDQPMLPLTVFRSIQFSGANLTTLVVYAALSGTFFLLVLQLQLSLHYSALEAGASLMPITLLMLALSARAGALAQRIGPRLPMTIGPLVAAVGLALFASIEPGATYARTVLPAVVVFGLGLTLTVAPLTAAVLAAVDAHHVGAGSGVNNAVARLGGLVAVATLPAIAGIDTSAPSTLTNGFTTAMRICAGLCAAGGVIAFLTVRSAARVRAVTQASVAHPCHHPDVAHRDAA